MLIMGLYHVKLVWGVNSWDDFIKTHGLISYDWLRNLKVC